MNAQELIRHVEDLGIELTLEGDKIRYRSTNGPPPVALLATITQHRDEIVTLLTRREALQWPMPRNNADVGPLSSAQRKVWATSFFLDDGTYNLSGALRLIGPLDQRAFDLALHDAYRRHPSLRTVFTVQNGEPTQLILSHGAPEMLVCDFSDREPNTAFDDCIRECETIVTGALELNERPPIRTRLYRLATNDHLFFVVLHHVIADGVSLRVLLDDLARCYSARVIGHPVEPLTQVLDMIDYARFEEEYVQCANLRTVRRYWKDILRGVELGGLPLPCRLEPLGSNQTSYPMAVTIDATTTRGVRLLASASRSSAFMIVSAAVSAMLSRFSGRNEMVIGLPVARRERPGLSELVGLLLDMVPVRLDVSGNPTFRELIQRTRKAMLGAVSHAVVPIEFAIDDYPAKQSGKQLYNVILTDNAARLPNPEFHGLDAEPIEVAQAGAKFELNFLVRDDGDTLHIDVEFDRRLLSKRDVVAMVQMTQAILAEGAAHATKRVCDLGATPAIRTSVTDAPTVSSRVENESLFSRLAAVAKSQADAVAISHDGTVVGYGAFYESVDQVARGLRRHGLGPGDVVAVALPRGVDLITAMIGIMGCGATCLVVNEDSPEARIEQILRDANVKQIIAPEGYLTGDRVSIAELIALGSGAEAAPSVPSSTIAYVIYTSGSSGQPKGVQVPHRNVLSLLDNTNARFGFNASDVWTQFHSCSFDFSIWEIFGCLLTGGKLVIVPKFLTWEPESFLQLLQRQKVSVLNLTPSALWASMTFIARDPSVIESVRYLIFGGEALPAALADRWYREAGKRTQLVNMYGITETTVHASWRWLKAGTQPIESDIGEAVPGVSLHLLYDNGRPVDDRCVGEIYVGGTGVAFGYLCQPRETAVRFVPDSFAAVPGSRMYRSGDLGRRNARAISYLGRRDSQVQVNGFRVELSEIEAALVNQSGVAAAAAATGEDASGTFIAAVVVANTDAKPSLDDVIQGLRTVLPRYMLPTAIAIVPELPLTVNGKLDRAAVLAAATAERQVSRSSESAVCNSHAEMLLLDLFKEVLHDVSITTHTDFFDHGGDSMRAIRLVSLARERGLFFGVRDVYAMPRLKDLAAHATSLKPETNILPEQPAFSLLPAETGSFGEDIEDAYPMTALQLGMIYLKELAPDSGIYHIVLSYRLAGRMDPEAFRLAAQGVTDRHAILRTSFDLVHPSGPIQRVHSRVEVPVEFEDLRHLGSAEQLVRVAEVVEQERGIDFDLSRPALFRLVVLTLSADDYQLIFTHHHIILDGWSVNIFFEDLHTQYMQNLSGGAATVLPRLQNLFPKYVALEQDAMRDPDELSFWQGRVSGELGLLVPQRSKVPVMRQVRPEMRKGMLADLRSTAAQLGVPVKALQLAAHVRVIAWLTGCDEFVTGVVVNCRPETPDSDRALGLFLNEYPIRIRLQNQSWAELAREVHLDEQAMMPHRWYPHALIQQHHGSASIFDNYFNFTEFYPTRRLVTETGLNVLDTEEIESTHYTLGVNYTVDVRSGELRLILEYDESALPHATVALAAEAHNRILAAIISNPYSACLSTPLPGVVDVARQFGDPLFNSPRKDPAPAFVPNLIKGTAGFRKPQTEIERSIQSVWMEVLGVVDLDMETNFFDVGGTSLRAMRVVSQLRALHGDLSMETFLKEPTIAALGLALSANKHNSMNLALSIDRSTKIPERGEGPQQYPLTLAQKHLWQLANELPGLPLFGMPGALRAEGSFDLDVLKRTFALLLDRHPALRARIAVTDVGPVQIVEPHAEVEFEVVDLRTSADPLSQCEQLMRHAVLQPIDLMRAPLLRAIVFQLAEVLHVIYLNIHHIVCDGESMALLMSEAAEIYGAIGADVRLPEPAPLGNGELAQAELEWMATPEAAEQRRYWTDRLAPPWPSLTDTRSRFGKREQTSFIERLRSASYRRVLPKPLVQLISAAARRHGLTEFMVVLTAFASTLREWSGEEDIRVATMMGNRVQPERVPVVGLLTNTVVLRLNIEQRHDVLDLSMQARRVCIEAFERQQLPFEDVLAALNSRYANDDRIGQLFEVMLLMQQETPEVAFDDGLRLAPYRPKRRALGPPVIPTTCEFVLAVTDAGGELVLDLLYTPATTDALAAEALLDDIAVAISTTAQALGNTHETMSASSGSV